jgi:hypothetical protein
MAAAAGAAADPGAPRLRPDRPLGITTPGTLRLLVLDMPLLDARSEPAVLEVRWDLANDWSTPTRLTRGGRLVQVALDEQADVLTLAVALPWARLLGAGPRWWDRLATRLEWRLIQHWGGWTDGPIEAWHRLAGLEGFARPLYPRGAVMLHLGEPGGARLFDLGGPRLAVGDLAVRTTLRLAEGEPGVLPWAVALRLDAKLPVGRPSEAGGSGGLDAGAGLAGSASLLPWLTAHGQASLWRVAPLPGGLPLQPSPWQWALEGSLTASSGQWTVLLETRWLSPLFPSSWRLSGNPIQGDAVTAVTRAQNQVTAGLRWRALTLWLSEDFTPGRRLEVGWRWFYDTNAPDLALGAALAVPF